MQDDRQVDRDSWIPACAGMTEVIAHVLDAMARVEDDRDFRVRRFLVKLLTANAVVFRPLPQTTPMERGDGGEPVQRDGHVGRRGRLGVRPDRVRGPWS